MGATNTLASRMIVMQSDPKVSSRAAGLARHDMRVNGGRQQTGRRHPLSQRAPALARERDQAIEPFANSMRPFQRSGPAAKSAGRSGTTSTSRS